MSRWIGTVFYTYVSLQILPFVVTLGGYLPLTVDVLSALMDPINGWTAEYLLGLEGVVRNAPNGSGDTLYNWVHEVTLLGLAVVVGSILTAAWRSERGKRRWYAWLLVLVTVYIASCMLLYGFAKVFPRQFGQPSLLSLYENYGQSSPMRLLWTFMSYSRPYTVFTGILEVAAGVLLIPRYTRTLGALLTLGIMANVLMLNLSYDVPVKIFSMQLIMLTLFLIYADRKRLLQFLRNNPVGPRTFPTLTHSERANRILSRGKYVLLVFICGLTIFMNTQSLPGHERSPLYGIYIVESMTEQRPDESSSRPRWQRLIFEVPEMMVAVLPDGSNKSFRCTIDADKRSLIVHQRDDPDATYMDLSYRKSEDGLVFTGTSYTRDVRIETETVDLTSFGINRGFNWVNETPYNRYQY